MSAFFPRSPDATLCLASFGLTDCALAGGVGDCNTSGETGTEQSADYRNFARAAVTPAAHVHHKQNCKSNKERAIIQTLINYAVSG